MSTAMKFDFGAESVAKAYDKVLVPVLFSPWARMMVQENMPWAGKNVLDLACGTGAVTMELAKKVLPGGQLIALDVNPQMLELAKINCADWGEQVQFIQGSGEALDIPSESIDTVVCQQGFQFFPDKPGATREIHRVLKPGGMAILSTWCAVSECDIIEAICDSLEEMGEKEISDLMRTPFDLLTDKELGRHFREAGFSQIGIARQEKTLDLEGGVMEAHNMAYATPIGPMLAAMDMSKQEVFRDIFTAKVQALQRNNTEYGKMVTNMLKVIK